MTTFVFEPTVPAGVAKSAVLGASTSAKFADADLGKPVKLGTVQNYVLATDGDDIEGFVVAIEPYTVNGGYSFGSVLDKGRFKALVDTSDSVEIGDYVVAGTQAALGTASLPVITKGVAFAQSGTTPFAVTEATPKHFFWRVVRIVSGTGAAGDTVLIERI